MKLKVYRDSNTTGDDVWRWVIVFKERARWYWYREDEAFSDRETTHAAALAKGLKILDAFS